MFAELLALRPELVLLDLDLGKFGDTTPLIEPLVAAGIRVLLVTGAPTGCGSPPRWSRARWAYARKADDFDVLLEQGAPAALAGARARSTPRNAVACWRS